MISGATHIEISMTNASEGYRIYDDVLAIEDMYLQDDNLYRALSKEYGRCISKVYIDTADGPKAIGWCFQKRVMYDDCDETFLRETWVSLLKNYDPTPRKEYAIL